MKALKKFNIDIFKLHNGKYNYEFELDKEFFEFFEYGYIDKGEGVAKVSLTKTETLIETMISVQVSVDLICDRSLETFDYPIDINHKLMFKFGDRDEEISDEIIMIERNTQRLNLAHYIYEFIGIAIPMKKIHPKFRNEKEDEDESDHILIYQSGQKADDNPENGQENDNTDPRWDLLKKLKDNLN